MERTSKLFFKDSNGKLKQKIIYINPVNPEFIFHSNNKYHSHKKIMLEIEYQNMEILGKNFYDKEIGVAVASKNFNMTYQTVNMEKDNDGNNVFIKNKNGKKILFVVGTDCTEDEWPYLLAEKKEAEEILEKIDRINEKYGILCRAEKGQPYYYINEFGEIKEKIENLDEEDNKRYELGNYFTLKSKAKIFQNRFNQILQLEIC
jgi:hypothetical protein